MIPQSGSSSCLAVLHRAGRKSQLVGVAGWLMAEQNHTRAGTQQTCTISQSTSSVKLNR